MTNKMTYQSVNPLFRTLHHAYPHLSTYLICNSSKITANMFEKCNDQLLATCFHVWILCNVALCIRVCLQNALIEHVHINLMSIFNGEKSTV